MTVCNVLYNFSEGNLFIWNVPSALENKPQW